MIIALWVLFIVGWIFLLYNFIFQPKELFMYIIPLIAFASSLLIQLYIS